MRQTRGLRLAQFSHRRDSALCNLEHQHHNKVPLFAGKLHAVLQRPYLKCRDIYELLWYLSDPTWPQPNLEMLNNVFAQSHWPGTVIKPDNWKGIVRRRLPQLDWSKLFPDVRSFLERSHEIELLTEETIKRLPDASKR